MELYDVMRTTFAARDYTGDPLPDEVLHEILENARFAPSGGNRQGNRVIVVRDPETRGRLARLAEPAAKRYCAQTEAGVAAICSAVTVVGTTGFQGLSPAWIWAT